MAHGVMLSDGRVWTWEPGRDVGPWSAFPDIGVDRTRALAPPAWLTADDLLRLGQYRLEWERDAVQATAANRLAETHRLRELCALLSRALERDRMTGDSLAGVAVGSDLDRAIKAVAREGKPYVGSLPAGLTP